VAPHERVTGVLAFRRLGATSRQRAPADCRLRPGPWAAPGSRRTAADFVGVRFTHMRPLRRQLMEWWMGDGLADGHQSSSLCGAGGHDASSVMRTCRCRSIRFPSHEQHTLCAVRGARESIQVRRACTIGHDAPSGGYVI